ncbi:MAG: site-2 protease family protein [Candidatus Marsarchaeota archaeon]|nr:site-2 protease family protein [Candidatus Marsarchaeota archaeon]
MADALKIARIWGIDIDLHWTFIALLLVTLYISIYSSLILFVIIVLLFVCVLVHELAHSFVSLRNGIPVSRIMLLPLGGVSIIDLANIDPRVEFNIAIAGPLMSFLLGAVFGLLSVLSPIGPVTSLLQTLFLLNILLGGFNLLPAFPTDGGRVFRSYLERKHDEYVATELTVKASNIILGLFVLGTVAYVLLIDAPFYSKEFIFLWNLLIVFFLYGGARQEKQMMEIKRRSRGIKLGTLATRHFALVKPESNVKEMYDKVRLSKEHLLITKLRGGTYAYINLLGKTALRPGALAGDVAVKIPSVDSGENIVDALETMESNEAGIAAVTRRGKLVGIVTISHIQAFLSLHALRAQSQK